MSWWKHTIDEKIEKLHNQIDTLLIEDAGVTAEYDTLRKIVSSGSSVPMYYVDKLVELSSKHAQIKQHIINLQSKRDALVSQKQIAKTLRGATEYYE